jgi:hypothetical protein
VIPLLWLGCAEEDPDAPAGGYVAPVGPSAAEAYGGCHEHVEERSGEDDVSLYVDLDYDEGGRVVGVEARSAVDAEPYLVRSYTYDPEGYPLLELEAATFDSTVTYTWSADHLEVEVVADTLGGGRRRASYDPAFGFPFAVHEEWDLGDDGTLDTVVDTAWSEDGAERIGEATGVASSRAFERREIVSVEGYVHQGFAAFDDGEEVYGSQEGWSGAGAYTAGRLEQRVAGQLRELTVVDASLDELGREVERHEVLTAPLSEFVGETWRSTTWDCP